MRTRFPDEEEPDGWDVIVTSALGVAFFCSLVSPAIGQIIGG